MGGSIELTYINFFFPMVEFFGNCYVPVLLCAEDLFRAMIVITTEMPNSVFGSVNEIKSLRFKLLC